MARGSLTGLLMVLGGQSCLITASPELEPPKRTPPYFASLSPPTFQVQKLTSLGTSPSSGTQIEFKVVSEDLGQPILGAVYFDFHGWGPMQPLAVIGAIKPGKIPAGHMADEEARPGSASFQITGAAGCHSATLVLSHEFNGPGDPRPSDLNDTAIATWWYFLDDDPLHSDTDISTCVTAPPSNLDAGAAETSDDGGR